MAKARVYVGIGHGGPDSGAVYGDYLEKDANLAIGLAMCTELAAYGVEVKSSRTADEEDRLQTQIDECNAYSPDIAVQIHNNSGGGQGFEVYRQTGTHRAESIKLAQCIERRVIESGQKSRGVKINQMANGKDYFGWLRELHCPAVLTEGFFIDNAIDRVSYDTEEELKALGVVYAHGVLDYLGIAVEEQPVLYRVQVGAFRYKSNAESYKKELESKGYHPYIIEVKDNDN